MYIYHVVLGINEKWDTHPLQNGYKCKPHICKHLFSVLRIFFVLLITAHVQIITCLHQNIYCFTALVSRLYYWLWSTHHSASSRQRSIKPRAAYQVRGVEWGLPSAEQRAQQEGVRLQNPTPIQRRARLQIYLQYHLQSQVTVHSLLICL